MSTATRVAFTRMADGTAEDYALGSRLGMHDPALIRVRGRQLNIAIGLRSDAGFGQLAGQGNRLE